MKKLILGCFLISGFAAAGTSVSENMETRTSGCDPEDIVFVSFDTSCGPPAVASGCTTEEIVADIINWEEFHCGPTIAP
jgi:hypothetical protein